MAEAFLAFLLSDEGQRIVTTWISAGEGRRGAPGGMPPLPAKVFTMADLGGSEKLEKELYGPKGIWTSSLPLHRTRERRGGNGDGHGTMKSSGRRNGLLLRGQPCPTWADGFPADGGADCRIRPARGLRRSARRCGIRSPGTR